MKPKEHHDIVLVKGKEYLEIGEASELLGDMLNAISIFCKNPGWKKPDDHLELLQSGPMIEKGGKVYVPMSELRRIVGIPEEGRK